MATVTDYLIQLQDLTKKNLEILQGINDSFFKKETHVKINVGNTDYIIPSYIALENKINALEEGFNNLINAPKTGEAFFNFNGNSRSIEVRGYTTTPTSIKLPQIQKFDSEKNNIFKDFLTPKPFIKFKLESLPDDITNVNVKKVIPINSSLKEFFKNKLFIPKLNDEESHNLSKTSIEYNYSELFKTLSLYEKDKDYVEYDTVMKLPIRKNIGQATYVIKNILKDITTEALEEFFTLKLRSDLTDYTQNLTYKLFDETIDVPLAIGDELITYDGNTKLEITSIAYNTNEITVKVKDGNFTNFVESNNDTNISDYSKLRFYSPINFNDDKYIKIPLEEDQYIFVAIAPLNDRMNIQSSWGSGLIIDTYKLLNDDQQNFKDYYNDNVNNIGDILYELTAVSTNGITKYSETEFNSITNLKPVINTNDLKVTQINDHLNDSDTVRNIKSLYSQKQTLNNKLIELQKNISDANETLSKISFDDTTGRRSEITSNISSWNNDKNETVTSINKVIKQISIAATNADVPIENAKYRIRGYFDFEPIINSLSIVKDHILGIQVQYRYKNMNRAQGSAMSINDKFIFSDWNIMKGINNPRVASYTGGKYKFGLKPTDDNANEPSCNQIDIPISQGETVDIKLRVVYDFGAPYIETTSTWSDIVNIEFPIEFTKDVQVLDIIKENNDDIETNRFNNILLDTGVTSHVNDKLVDQDLTYFHKSESISSGFVTPERRIIPLKDKLITMDKLLSELNDIVKGSTSESLSISIVNGDNINTLYPWQNNNISVDAYNTFNVDKDMDITSGTYDIQGYLVSTILNIVIKNTSKHIVNLFSIFPGSKDASINSLPNENTKYMKSDYCTGTERGVWIVDVDKQNTAENLFLQTANQFVTFRIKNIIDQDLYTEITESSKFKENLLAYNKSGVTAPNINEPNNNNGMWVYPIVKDHNDLIIDNINNSLGRSIDPGEQVIIPIMVQYNLDGMSNLDLIKKTLSFDLRTSLYTDPINYSFTVVAKKVDTIQDKVLSNNKKAIGNKYNISVE